MKIKLNLKTPDLIHYAFTNYDISDEEQEEMKEKMAKWVKYGEKVTIEFDSDKNTMRVLEC